MKRLCQFSGMVPRGVMLVVLLFGITELFSQNIPQGALNGKFSVSENGDMVQFSQGNLQYIGSASTPYWKFAENQWDYIGTTSAQNCASANVDRDLFGWGTSGYNHGAFCYQPWSVSIYSSKYFAYGNSLYNLDDQTGKADWGYNRISNGGNTENTWRTLTINEWYYLLDIRNTNSGVRYAMAKVNNVNGLILLPDNWSTSYYSLNSTNINSANYSSNIITASQWNALEQHGAVFLPAAGNRDATTFYSVGSCGNYWSATHYDNDCVYDVCFCDGGLYPADYTYFRGLGFSVRLVCDTQDYSYNINATPDPADGGSVSGSGTYVNGSTCTVTANPNPEYYFVVWTENGTQVSTDAEYTFTVDKDRLLVAHFQQQTYTISVSHFPSAGGSVTGGGNFTYGNQCTVTASANPGFHFVNWTENGNQVSTNATYTFNVTDSRDLMANFALDNVGPEQIAFADANVKAICVANWDTNGDGELSYSEAASVTSIGTKFEKSTTITSFDEFQYFTGVTTLVGGLKPSGTPGITLQYGAFYCCSNLTSIIIPDNVTEINSYGFSGCSGLTSLTVNATIPPTLGNNVFSNVPKNIPVYVPCAAVSAYMTASGWSEFTNYQGMDCVYHQITATANPTEGGVVSGGGSYVQGTSCILTATANPGYTFVNWTENGIQVSTNATFTFDVTAPRTLVANFTQINPDEIIVFADANVKAICVANWDTNGDGELSYDEAAAVTDLNYVFQNNTAITSFDELQYFTGITELKGYAKTMVLPNHNFLTTYHGDFLNCNSLTSVVIPNGIISIGSYAFKGCSGLATMTVLAETPPTLGTNTFLSVDKDIPVFVPAGTVAAYQAAYGWSEFTNFQEIPVPSYEITATASPSEGGTISGMGIYNSGSSCTLTAVANEGYTFVNWTENGNLISTDADYTFTVTGTRNLVANFSLNSYTVSTSSNPTTGGTTVGEGTYNYGTLCTLSATANEGYTFINWTENGNHVSTDAVYTFTITGTRNLVANFSLNSYTVSTSSNPTAGGTTTGEGTYTYGTTCSLMATANEGYTFINWTENGNHVSTDAVYTFTVTENKTLVANFSLNIYAITVLSNPIEGGSATGGGAYSYGANCTLTATANEGYTFTNWTKGGTVVSTNPIYNFTVAEAADYVANFTLNSYEITAVADPVTGGTVTGSGTYNHGATCTLTASSATNYNFVNWTKDGVPVSTNEAYVFTVTGEGDYVAHFSEVVHYTISVTANPAEGGAVTGGGSFVAGETATLTATANQDYTFTNWTEGGVIVSNGPTYSFTVANNRNLVANFQLQGSITNHWIPESANYDENMALTGVIQIDGVEQYSDQLEVGAFCGSKCRGSAIAIEMSLTNRYLVNLTIFGEENDAFTFKLYDHSLSQELELISPDAVAFDLDGYGDPSAPYVLNFTSGVTQTSSLVNGWNWYSTYIEQSGIDGLAMLEESLGNAGVRIQARNQYTEHFEYQGEYYWYGTLNSIANEQMYKVRTNSVCDVEITGFPAYPINHPITIIGGWNWIGFPVSQNVSVETALAGFTPEEGDVLKGRNGSTTYIANYGWYGTLNTLEPGRGYMYKSNVGTAKSLVFQTGAKADAVVNIAPENNVFVPNDAEYADNMLVTAVIDLDGKELRSDDYELAAFVGDECRGSVKLMYVEPLDRYVAFLTVFGDEVETINYVLTDGNETAWSNNSTVYSTDALVGTLSEPAVICFGTMGLSDNKVNTLVYPNPTKDVFNVRCEGLRKIEVLNAYGQLVMTKEERTDHLQIDLSNHAEGVYLLRLFTDNETITRQIIKK